jgi:hypothetical protein
MTGHPTFPADLTTVLNLAVMVPGRVRSSSVKKDKGIKTWLLPHSCFFLCPRRAWVWESGGESVGNESAVEVLVEDVVSGLVNVELSIAGVVGELRGGGVFSGPNFDWSRGSQ